jgi:single-strand DNA-binding protein
MSSVNKVILIGRAGKAAEVREVGSDKKASFSLATSESYKNRNDEWVENTEWHNIEAWGRLADIAAKYVAKGLTIYVEGSIRSEKYKDKDGIERTATKIRAAAIQLLDKKAAAAGNAIDDDDMPE